MMNYLFMHLFSYEEINKLINEDFDSNMKHILEQMNNSIIKSENNLISKHKHKQSSFQELNLKSLNFNSN